MYKLWAPVCSVPGCNELVHYHSKKKVAGGTISYKWEVFCEKHRTTGRAKADLFKLSRGCANVFSKYNFPCTSTISHAVQLDLHHLDGNRKNNGESNIEVLCSCCHRLVTLLNKDHLNREEPNLTALNTELFEIE